MRNYKSIFRSRTFWVAVAQGITGVAVVVLTQLDPVGYGLIIKALGDIMLRLDTEDAVGL